MELGVVECSDRGGTFGGASLGLGRGWMESAGCSAQWRHGERENQLPLVPPYQVVSALEKQVWDTEMLRGTHTHTHTHYYSTNKDSCIVFRFYLEPTLYQFWFSPGVVWL